MAEETPYFLQDPNAPVAPTPQATPTARPPVELPPLPQSGMPFNIPYLGGVLDVMRDLIVGPNADYLNTKEQVTRGILNTLVLAKNPGALPAMYGRYDAADANEFQKYQDPRFRERVRILADPNGDFKLPEDAAINRAADEFQLSAGIARPRTLRELPTPDPIAMTKYKFGKEQYAAAQEMDRPADAYQAVGPYPAWRVKQAHDRQVAGVNLTPEDQQILATEAQQAPLVPGADLTKMTTKPGQAPATTYEMRPRAYMRQPDGTYVDNAGRVVQGPPTSVPQGMPGAPGTAPAPGTAGPGGVDQGMNWVLGPDAAGNLTWQQIPKTAETIEKEGLMQKKAGIDVAKSDVIHAQNEAASALQDFDFVNQIVGSYNWEKDPTTGEQFTLDTNGNRYVGAPGQIRGGTGLYQFLNPNVFSLPIIDVDSGSLMSNIKGAIQNKYEGFKQSMRIANKLDPDNILLGRYDAWVNERVPGYLKAARVTRTTQTEIDLLKQAFPNPSTMPLSMATEMADQLKGVMESRARTAAVRVEEAKRGLPLTPYRDESIQTSQGVVTIPGGNPPLNAADLKPIDSFAGATTKPAEPALTETDDDIVIDEDVE